MNNFQKIISKFTNILSPIWTLVSIIAAIIYVSWIVAAWCFKQSTNDEQLFAADARFDARLTMVENGLRESSENQTKMLYILSRLEGKKNEMVD